MMLHWSLLTFTICITRTLTWGSLKDNSVCCQIFWTAVLADIACLQGHQGSHPGKHACRRTNLLPACLVIEVDKLVRIYLTSPVTTATGERSFSVLRCIKTYLKWSTMSQQHLNNRMLLNVHKDLTDGLGFAHHRQAVRGRQWTPQAFLWHCAQSTVTPTRETGVNTVLDLLD